MNNLWLSAESIKFQQNENFKIQLTELIDQLKAANIRSGGNHEILQLLQKNIIDNSGINVNVIQKEDANGVRIGLPMITKNHVLFDMMRQTAASNTDLIREIGSKKFISGFADPATGKIGGDFSKVVVDLHLPNSEVFDSDLTSSQIAAIILHELGHIWCFYYYLGSVTRTSVIFEYIRRELADEPDERKRVTVITTAGRAAGMNESDIRDLYKVKSDEILATVIVSNAADVIRSDLGSNIFDHTTWEALADEYAVRMGAGIELATALDSITRRGLSRAHRGWTVYFIFEVIKLMLLAIPGLNFIGVMLILMDASSSYHDDPEARMKRIRNQFVEGLKRKGLTTQERQTILDNIDRMNELLESVTDKPQFLSVIIEAVVPSMRKRKSTLEKIRILESLTANELFTISQQIKTDATS